MDRFVMKSIVRKFCKNYLILMYFIIIDILVKQVYIKNLN